MQTNDKMIEQGKMQTWTWFLLGMLMLTLCVSWSIFLVNVIQLEKSTEGLNYIEYMNAGTQRLVRLELTNNQSDEIIFTLETVLNEITPTIGTESEYFQNEIEILEGIEILNEDWQAIQEGIEAFRVDGNEERLLSISERHFYHVTNLSNDTLDYISRLSTTILWSQSLLIFQIALIGIIISYQVWRTLKILKHNRTVAASMFIDSATGLFNRSKCQEVLRMDISPSESKTRAMVVFDLNDLKKTNDLYGHQVGDDLISNFAKIIQEATAVNNSDAFVGRYGGDEFIVYYNYVTEYNLKLYLEEVVFQTDYFNNQEHKYQISYAVGYAISSFDTPQTMRQLFDIADEQMYKNKVEIKEKRRLETGEVGLR